MRSTVRSRPQPQLQPFKLPLVRFLRALSFMASLLLSWRNLRLVQKFLKYLDSVAIGSSVTKIWYRFRDLSLIFGSLSDHLTVTEFGQGSSTFFFLGSRKVQKLISFEENAEYVLKIVSPKWKPVLAKVRICETDGVTGTRYVGSGEYIKQSDFVYVDGPVSGLHENALALPNLDLFDTFDLEQKTIAIDCRTNTVLLMLKKLSKSHILIPSLSVMRESKQIGAELPNESLRLDNYLAFNSFNSLVRTSIFLPRQYVAARI